MAKEKTILELDSEYNLSFVAAWRTFERVMNPAFYFMLVCPTCNATGGDDGGPHPVYSKKIKDRKVLIGIMCGCGRVLKFGGGIDPKAKTFPQRLIAKPLSVLGSSQRDPDVVMDDIDTILFDE